jgi:HEAT repeat protein
MFSPDDALPPVEPPTASFIIKLFVVPAVIVVVVLCVVLGFNWLAQRGGNAYSYVAAIEGDARNSWQAAHDLAMLLPGDKRLQSDPQLAKRLSDVLIRRVKSGPPKREKKIIQDRVVDKDDRKLGNEAGLRVYLATALGHFAIPEALPGLLAAVQQERNEDEMHVRLGALEGMAMLAHNAAQNGQPLADAEVPKVLLAASREPGNDHREIRERAAYALGVLGGEESIKRLEEMLSDLHVNVRFNAAIGLARHGSPQSIPVLAEMIDPDETAGVDVEPEEKLKENKALAIRISGLSAAEQLVKSKPMADFSSLVAALKKLRDLPGVHPELKGKTLEILGLLGE